MAHLGRVISAVSALLVLCFALRPEREVEGSKVLALAESIGGFQKVTADAGLDRSVDEVISASGDALKTLTAEALIEGQAGAWSEELPVEAKDALARVLNVVRDTMMPTLDELHREEGELLDTVHAEVTECNTGMTSRLDGDVGGLNAKASKLRGEEEALAQRLEELRSQNKSDHEQLAAFMVATQSPSLCNSFPTAQIEEDWADFYRRVEEYTAVAAAQAKDLSDKRSKRDATVALLTQTNEEHISTTGSLKATFCDWKSEALAACATHGKCYIEKSARLEDLIQQANEARGKRVLVYQAALKVINSINAMMDESAAPVNDDAEIRFAPSGTSVPAQAACDLSALNDWSGAGIFCATDSDGKMFKVLSVEHDGGTVGMYFNFDVASVTSVLGRELVFDEKLTVANLRSGWKGTAVFWTNRRGGSVGDGHGRRDAGSGPGQWRVGDEIVFSEAAATLTAKFGKGCVHEESQSVSGGEEVHCLKNSFSCGGGKHQVDDARCLVSADGTQVQACFVDRCWAANSWQCGAWGTESSWTGWASVSCKLS
jgi:hypothetical protein